MTPALQDDPKTLVSTQWLAAHLKDPDLRILDASWFMPDTGRNGRAEYEAGHIPGARFFDIDEISDHRSALPHMAPPSEKFISRMRAMGVGDGHQVVVYDGTGLFSAARVWWTFRLMGKTDVAVLDGGLPKWLAEGRPVDRAPPVAPAPAVFHASRRSSDVADLPTVLGALTGEAQIVDARPAPRFRGEVEPIDRVGGHIPGAHNRPFAQNLDTQGRFKPVADLRAEFTALLGGRAPRDVVHSCGSGVTACHNLLAMEAAGLAGSRLFAPSWSGWIADPARPVATGA